MWLYMLSEMCLLLSEVSLTDSRCGVAVGHGQINLLFALSLTSTRGGMLAEA